MMDALNGNKTYLAAAGMIAYAVIGLALGLHTSDKAVELILQALAIIGLRHGIAKVQE